MPPDRHCSSIDDDRVRFEPADHCSASLRPRPATRSGPNWARTFALRRSGIAGERGVRYAAISNDGRLAGRTGDRRRDGSKGLKAIAVRGSKLPAVADPRGLAVAARDLAARSLGPGTAKYREIGTAANLAFFNRLGVLPTRNFQSGSFAGAEAISGETLLLEHHTDKNGCAACTVGCEHRYRTADGGPPPDVRLEYETLFALGSLCGVADPNAVLRAAALCDELGIDAISTGATIAWAMECRAARDRSRRSHVETCRSSATARALAAHRRQIGHRAPGIGDLLAKVHARRPRRSGRGARRGRCTSKGWSCLATIRASYRRWRSGLAVATRGACHNRSSAYEADLSVALDPAADALARARAAAAAEDQAALLDSLTLCKFLRHVLHGVVEEGAALLQAVTGLPTSADDVLLAAGRINDVKKRFNLAQGWTRDLDTLPPRLFQDDGEQPYVDRAALERQIQAYYAVRGWDNEGRPPEIRAVAENWRMCRRGSAAPIPEPKENGVSDSPDTPK